MRSFLGFVIFSCFLVFSASKVWAQKTATTSSAKTASGTTYINPLDRVYWERLHPAISLKYLRGNFLIYDCESQHFACVEEGNFMACKEKRQNLLLKGEERLPCAAIREYPTYSLCIKRQYELMHNGVPPALCFKPNLN